MSPLFFRLALQEWEMNGRHWKASHRPYFIELKAFWCEQIDSGMGSRVR